MLLAIFIQWVAGKKLERYSESIAQAHTMRHEGRRQRTAQLEAGVIGFTLNIDIER